ncbi:hypothetical protein NLM33_36565 [Bradyrhizobium sp. CCGUVB1N3]|uniref:hypothetical protein n=1 Tax=Bradyrhizobium sp. CCGUVB1N3 TaxID=2949629 RepID=UPI0020B32A71|nr:hypothetical protein [Bradyrhizobium sp. CCGUVB1N3]MCP3475767.1 hypothetical protein [Bradyrhizobium sp. CCGUVB1N3]
MPNSGNLAFKIAVNIVPHQTRMLNLAHASSMLGLMGKKKGRLIDKRPKSREETPKEGSGSARRYRTAIIRDRTAQASLFRQVSFAKSVRGTIHAGRLNHLRSMTNAMSVNRSV